jgi:uracil-DNA glycosylase
VGPRAIREQTSMVSPHIHHDTSGATFTPPSEALTGDPFEVIRSEIVADPINAAALRRGWSPLFTSSANARVAIIGQAPGVRAQESGIPWNDPSGHTLRNWMGVSDEVFYESGLIALVPMDFFYPGKGRTGDLPPRRGFAATWHPRLFDLMPDVQLTLLIGTYAQTYYLDKSSKMTLTETVRGFREYLPAQFPLVHPSPLNFRWQSKNPWFAEDVLPALGSEVRRALNT